MDHGDTTITVDHILGLIEEKHLKILSCLNVGVQPSLRCLLEELDNPSIVVRKSK